jgi:nitrite reductase/ring-hydroxylating ferredoxin subunit
MSFLVNPFARPSRAGDAWFCAGPASSYPNLDGSTRVGEQRLCRGQFMPGCRVFRVPRDDSSQAVQVAVDEWKAAQSGDAKDQVMIFQYAGKFVAVNHECPHSSYPLSNGTPFDIEDFGVKLSSAITCPQHDWSFDLHTGKADRGSYKLQVWELQQRPAAAGNGETDVWVRRKQKFG